MMQEIFARLTEVIGRYGGVVDKYIGDCIMALFGAPKAHENDPERSVLAALGMQQALQKFRREKNLEIGMRVGVNTGMVLAGYVGNRSVDYTVMGDEVNIASRLEQAAPVDGILISSKTFSHVSDLFDCEALPAIAVKGKAEPVAAYRVLRDKRKRSSHDKVRSRSISTPMVGRDAELKLMLESAQSCRQAGQSRLIFVKASPGGGKSRLLYEFHRCEKALAAPPHFFVGRASPYTVNTSYYLFGEILRGQCGIADEDKAAVVRYKLLAGVGSVMSTAGDEEIEETTHLMASLLNIDFPGSPYLAPLREDPIQLRQRAHGAFLRFFRSSSSEPTLLYLEDLHWADHPSLDLIAEIYQDNRERPLLIVALARPEFFERFPSFLGSFAGVEKIELAPLGEEAVRALIRELLKPMGLIPENLYRLVIRKSEGNPYYVEELIKRFIEAGVIEKGDAGSPGRVFQEKLQQIKIPDTIQGLLQTRLDDLKEEEKGVLQRAAIVGGTFWQRAVDILLEDLEVSSTGPVLSDLSRKEFILPSKHSALFGDEFMFKHALLRDVTYETILKKKRTIYHALVAEWLEKNSGDRKEEHLPLIAIHYELGHKPEQAREYYFLAGEQARKTFANHEALSYFDKVIQLQEKPRFSHYRVRGATSDVLGDYESALKDYQAMLGVCRNRLDEGVAFKHLAETHIRLGHYELGRDFVEKALQVGQELKDWKMCADSLNLKGRIDHHTGESDRALECYAQSIAIHRQNGSILGESRALGNQGVVYVHRGEYDKAIAAYRAALDLDRAQNNKQRMTMMMSNLGECYQFLGAMEQAIGHHQEALALARGIGYKIMEIETLRNLGIEHVHQGRMEQGFSLLRESLRMVDEVQDMELLPQVLYSLGEGLFLGGQKAEALTLAQRLLDIAEKNSVKDYIAKGLLLKSYCLSLTQGQEDLRRGLQIAQELRATNLLWEFYYALSLASVDLVEALGHIRAAKENVDLGADSIADADLKKSFLTSPRVAAILSRFDRLTRATA